MLLYQVEILGSAKVWISYTLKLKQKEAFVNMGPKQGLLRDQEVLLYGWNIRM